MSKCGARRWVNPCFAASRRRNLYSLCRLVCDPLLPVFSPPYQLSAIFVFEIRASGRTGGRCDGPLRWLERWVAGVSSKSSPGCQETAGVTGHLKGFSILLLLCSLCFFFWCVCVLIFFCLVVCVHCICSREHACVSQRLMQTFCKDKRFRWQTCSGSRVRIIILKSTIIIPTMVEQMKSSLIWYKNWVSRRFVFFFFYPENH